jgi:hypothetical protein
MVTATSGCHPLVTSAAGQEPIGGTANASVRRFGSQRSTEETKMRRGVMLAGIALLATLASTSSARRMLSG